MIESDVGGFFRVEDDHFVGNDPARGPWAADACHGGPVAGVVVRALESVVADKQLARVTINFQRPVPIAGFRVSADIQRDGRASAAATATLTGTDGRVCAVASSLHLATASFESLPTATVARPRFEEAVSGAFLVQRARHGLPFFQAGVEVAYPPGETPDPGPTTVWMRTLPIVAGERPSPYQALCPLADCGNAISRNASFANANFVNPDLTIAVFRLPESEWMASSAVSFWEPSGLGLAQAQLFDTRGAVGFALQTLLVQPVQTDTKHIE